MATTFYITAGLTAQDSAGAIGSMTYYLTAGLTANDWLGESGTDRKGTLKYATSLNRLIDVTRIQNGAI